MNLIVYSVYLAGVLATVLHVVFAVKSVEWTVRGICMEDVEKEKSSLTVKDFSIQQRLEVPGAEVKLNLTPEAPYPIAGPCFTIENRCLTTLVGDTSDQYRKHYKNPSAWTAAKIAAILVVSGMKPEDFQYALTYESLARAAVIFLEVVITHDDDKKEVIYYHVEVEQKLKEIELEHQKTKEENLGNGKKKGTENTLPEIKNVFDAEEHLLKTVFFKVGARFSENPPDKLSLRIHDKKRIQKLGHKNEKNVTNAFTNPNIQGVPFKLLKAKIPICENLGLLVYIVEIPELTWETSRFTVGWPHPKIQLRGAIGGDGQLFGTPIGITESEGRSSLAQLPNGEVSLKYLCATKFGELAALILDGPVKKEY